ncbi:MAG: 23S rRNA (uracil(1939)-C(5))-methyltransferase RlmD, partial [Anaeroplasmataceae bacterium]|nr:23S rRNA (uracil(1939)-C(5))-methyltransferase RlmD [Anaeroplasmataceae bacterium]
MEEGKIVRLEIEGYDMNGLGVAKLDGLVIFVSKALKGEVVMAELTNVHKKFAFAKAVKIITPSLERILSPCPYEEGCGGCDLLHMKYKTECKVKEDKVINAFAKINKENTIQFNPIIKNKNIFGYRNKVMMPFGYDEDDNVIYGFYEKLSHSLVSIDHCEISNHYVNEVVEFIRKFVSVMHIKVYNEETHTGIFRGVMVRNNYKNEMMVVLITTKYYDFSRLIEYIDEGFPLVKSMYININPNKTNVMLSNEYIHIYKDKTLIEDILGLKFSVSAGSFMQVNHDACEKLYQEALRMAKLTKDMNVIDAYCGMGSITLNIAKQVNHVYGIEIVEDAIINANYNKELNNISNATFICGPCEEEIKKLTHLNQIDCIFFDPPRKGCEQSFLDTVIEMKIPKIIYISCNIATAVRDIEYLQKHNYIVLETTPCDLFSKTSHTEVISSLVRVENK